LLDLRQKLREIEGFSVHEHLCRMKPVGGGSVQAYTLKQLRCAGEQRLQAALQQWQLDTQRRREASSNSDADTGDGDGDGAPSLDELLRGLADDDDDDEQLRDLVRILNDARLSGAGAGVLVE
jgi:hypothetical protein